MDAVLNTKLRGQSAQLRFKRAAANQQQLIERQTIRPPCYVRFGRNGVRDYTGQPRGLLIAKDGEKNA